MLIVAVGNSWPLALSDSPAWEVANRPLKVAVWLFWENGVDLRIKEMS